VELSSAPSFTEYSRSAMLTGVAEVPTRSMTSTMKRPCAPAPGNTMCRFTVRPAGALSAMQLRIRVPSLYSTRVPGSNWIQFGRYR
jgi:hypothetical protein